MERGDLLGVTAALQLLQQKPLKQMVVAVPFVSRIQGDAEQIALLQQAYEGSPIEVGQPGFSIRHADGIAKRRAEAVQDAGLPQPLPHRGRLRVDHLSDQVVLELWQTSAETGQEAVGIVLVAQGQCDQAQTGDPALQHSLQIVQGVLTQGEPGALFQEGLGLGGGELEVFQPQLHQLVLRAHRGQAQRRVAPRGNHQVQVPGWMHQ